LLNGTNHVLVGYPTRGVLNSDKGRMHATQLGRYYFSNPSPSLAPQVFVSTDFAGLPGASGGPLCVLYGTNWYPAGVYLGVTASGDARVRSIDGPLGALIQKAVDAANASADEVDPGPLIPISVTNASGNVWITINVGPSSLLNAWEFLHANLWCKIGDGTHFSTNYFTNSLSL